ncbi:V-type ATP synthase subunit E, partial [Patescibacteria group bacterium]|nr:V-type ATP synthase subunit E [Patescibacteria group bacterium]
MALSDIIQKIKDESNKKAAFMRQVADDEIQNINKEAVKKADAKKQEIEESADKKCQSVIEKAKILAKMESGSTMLREKREVIDAAYAEVEKEFNALSDHDYVALISKMLKSASTTLSKGDLIVPKDKKKQTEEAVQKAGAPYHIKDETSDFKGGFIVHTSKIEVNLSFPYLINKMIRPKTELEVAKILFD